MIDRDVYPQYNAMLEMVFRFQSSFHKVVIFKFKVYFIYISQYVQMSPTDFLKT